MGEIFRALTNRLRDSTWTIVYKSLIIVHLMIREGEPEVTLRFLAKNPRRTLAISHFTEVQTQGQNIRNYAEYLLCRAEQYGSTKIDYVRAGEGRLKRLNIEKGLLRETESVQDQIKFLLRCEVYAHASTPSWKLLTAMAAFPRGARERDNINCVPPTYHGPARALSHHERGYHQCSG